MAKAALNMMTRTSAADYVRDGIHMNSVDTGWVTDEDPQVHATRKTEIHGFHPPLDIVDGAARIAVQVWPLAPFSAMPRAMAALSGERNALESGERARGEAGRTRR